MNTYEVYYRDGGHESNVPLQLSWEVNYESICSNYLPDEITAEELFTEWLRGKPDQLVSVYWSVVAPSILLHETAPFQGWGEDFTNYFRTSPRINWATLPVVDKLWSRGDGFIQSATGWKPSPLQPSVPLALLVDAYRAGVSS